MTKLKAGLAYRLSHVQKNKIKTIFFVLKQIKNINRKKIINQQYLKYDHNISIKLDYACYVAINVINFYYFSG